MAYELMRVLTREKAQELVLGGLKRCGFIRASSGVGTTYLFKPGIHAYLKIRVSDHRDPGKNDDVVADVVLDAPTIHSDVSYRIEKANADFLLAVRARRLNRCT